MGPVATKNNKIMYNSPRKENMKLWVKNIVQFTIVIVLVESLAKNPNWKQYRMHLIL